MGRRGRPGFGAARCPLIISLLLCAVARAQDGEDGGNTGPQCSEDRLDLCDDLCTLDGKRPNPCPLECNVQTGDCYDRCVNPIEDGALPYDVNDAIINDAFDRVCANRLRKRIAESLVTDSFQSTLRDPPAVSSGLSSVPFSMFRNGLLHTGRSDHKGPSVTVAGVPRVGWTYKTGGRIFIPHARVRRDGVRGVHRRVRVRGPALGGDQVEVPGGWTRRVHRRHRQPHRQRHHPVHGRSRRDAPRGVS